MNTWVKIAGLILILMFSVLYIYFKKTLLTYQNDDLVLIHPFFPKKQFSDIVKYCKTLDSKLENDNRVKSRKTYMCDSKTDSSLYYMIYSSHLFQQMRKILKRETIYASEFPIEYRKYETGSEGMDWHSDVPMFSTQSMECVLTLKNTSDSHFYWKDNDIIKKISTKPNTLVIVLSNSVKHMVSKLNFGERFILKFVHHQKDSDHTQSFYYHRQKCPK